MNVKNQNGKTSDAEASVNSIGLKMITIKPGRFMMGAVDGDDDAFFDETPRHGVAITYSFEMGATEITNAQYEMFDASHKELRGDGKGTGFSMHDDEAVVNVSRVDALRFCKWLSDREGKHYRLPTEAEWEYACRAGTETRYHTGDSLDEAYCKEQRLVKKWNADKFYRNHDLRVGRTPPNAWGLHDMHGNVENWCTDRFSYYKDSDELNPVSMDGTAADGNAYVTRGGSYGVKVEHLRSSRRLGALETERNWLIGFRVVCGPTVEDIVSGRTEEVSRTDRSLLRSACFRDVSSDVHDWEGVIKRSDPVYRNPIPYLIPARDEDRFMIRPHNHCPAITWCDNGDLLTVWFSTVGEHDRDMYILGSRLRRDADEYDPASLFFRVPGRNMTGSSLLNDGNGRLYHINGMEVATSWKTLAMIMRMSTDNGETWTDPVYIDRAHRWRNQVIPGAFVNSAGDIVQLCDATPRGSGGSAFWLGKGTGLDPADMKWKDLGRNGAGRLRKKPRFWRGREGAWIAGIHAKAAEIPNSNKTSDDNVPAYIAYGRANNIRRGLRLKMPKSVSNDGGKTWRYEPSDFPGISYGQRLVLLRLREGPLFFASFTGAVRISGKYMYKLLGSMKLPIHNGDVRKCHGIFAAASFDDGKTWPARRFIYISTSDKAEMIDGFGVRRKIICDETHGELKGYLAGVQSPDGMIHLISSRNHYRFNLEWLTEFHR